MKAYVVVDKYLMVKLDSGKKVRVAKHTLWDRDDEGCDKNDAAIVFSDVNDAIELMKDKDRIFEIEVSCEPFDYCMEVFKFNIISEVPLTSAVKPIQNMFDITSFYIKSLARYLMGNKDLEALDHMFIELLNNHSNYAIDFYRENCDKMYYMDYLLDEGLYSKVIECGTQLNLLNTKQAFLIDAITNIQKTWDDIGILYDDEYEFFNEDELYGISIGSLSGSECPEDLKVVLKGCLLFVNENIYAVKSELDAYYKGFEEVCKIPQIDRVEQEKLLYQWEIMRANVIRRKDTNNIVLNKLLDLPKDCVIEVLASEELKEERNKSRYFAALFKGTVLEYMATKASYIEYYPLDDNTISIQYDELGKKCIIILGRDFK